jgi:peptidoglycan/LPS O-acetylase OafA/YrhL
MGVSVFFALSGFLITRRLMEEWRSAGRISWKNFYIRRAFRILPPMLVYLTVISLLGFGLHWIPMDRQQLAASLFFYRNYFTAPVTEAWYTGHFWSLAVEEHFYLVWPVLLGLAGLRRARWLAPALALTVAAWRAADMRFDWVGGLNPALRGYVGRTDYRLDILLYGCAVALLWDDAWVKSLLPRVGGSLLALLAAVAAVCCQVGTPPGYLTLVAIFMALLPAATVAKPRSWTGQFLELPLLAWVGRMSYSLYIWQQLFLPASGLPQPLGIWQQAPWNLAAALACALTSYYLVERPAIRWGKSMASLRFE